MSKQVKRSVILEFLENSIIRCSECGHEQKITLRCANCKTPVRLKECHFFHLIPIASGGKDEFSNIIMLCPTCSQKIDLIREKLRRAKNKKLTAYE
ncbi:MAG: HNH endonuclease [Candidatus Woesearchaeota archaeon]